MDLRALMNPAAEARPGPTAANHHPAASPTTAQSQAAQAYALPISSHSPQFAQHAQVVTKTPQRTASLASLPPHYQSHSNYSHASPSINGHSPPPLAAKNPPALPRTTSLPAHALSSYRRESSASVSPKTMPPPLPRDQSAHQSHTPQQRYASTPSPALSRKRSLSHLSADTNVQTPSQPPMKRRKYDPKNPPPWARRERDGFKYVPVRREEGVGNHNSATSQSQSTPQTQAQSQTQAQGSSQPPPTPQPVQQAAHANVNGPPPPHSIPPPQHQQHPHGFEPSLDNYEPYNDMERQICDFLFDHIIKPDWRFQSNTKIEVEAKLGSIEDWRDPNMRLQLGILTDAVLDPNMGNRPKFKSSMRTDQHARLNKYLNSEVSKSRAAGRIPIDYKHTKETDLFYDIPAYAVNSIDPVVLEQHSRSSKGGRAPRLRVTTDNATGAITAMIIKTRIADLEVRCPADEFDFRVSVSLETQFNDERWQSFPEYLDNGIRTSRNKDRLSYRHQGFLVDLTQVTPFAKHGNKVEKVHELEIEMDTDKLLDEGHKNARDQPNEFAKLVHVFVNNVKVVNRAAKVMPGQGQGGPMGMGMGMGMGHAMR